MATLNFDANQHEDPQDFSPIPAGDYVAMAIDSEMKETKAGTGHYLQITWSIIDGEHKGRQLWSRLNLDNPSQEAVNIANKDLASLCRAVQVLEPKDSAQLHSLPLLLGVKIKKRSDTGEMTNEVAKYKPLGNRQPTVAPPASQPVAAAPQAAAPAAAPPAAAVPWAK